MSRDPIEGDKTRQPASGERSELLRKIKEDDDARTAGTIAPQPGVSVIDAAKTIRGEDFLKIHQAPCNRQGFLSGLGGGAAIGALRFVLGASIPKATSWAVWSGIATSVISYELCQAYRRSEKTKMKRVVQVYDKKQGGVRLKEERDRRIKDKEEEEDALTKLVTQKKWYKFW